MCHLVYLLLPCVSRQHHGRTWWQWRWKVCKLRHMSNMSFVFLLSRWNDANQLCPCFTCCFIGGWLLGSLELDNGFMTVWQAEPLEQVHWNLGGRNYIELTPSHPVSVLSIHVAARPALFPSTVAWAKTACNECTWKACTATFLHLHMDRDRPDRQGSSE